MRKILLLPLILNLLLSCVAKDPQDSQSGPLRVKIPIFNPEAPDSYAMKTVQVDTVEHLKTFSGSTGQFFFTPGSLNGKLVGHRPSVKLGRDAEGTYFPTDLLSLQIVSIYYHLEQLRYFDRELKIESSTNWPKSIALNARLPSRRDDFRHNNAFYSPELDALVFVPYTQKRLPITVNAGVIAHEHFHSLFESYLDRSVKKLKLYEEKTSEAKVAIANSADTKADKVAGPKFERIRDNLGACKGAEQRPRYLITLNRALNEGLADVWAWLATGDTRFVERSLHQGGGQVSDRLKITPPSGSRPLCGRMAPRGVSRDLDSEVQGEIENCACLALKIQEAALDTKSEEEARENSVGLAYHLGSRIAKTVKQFVQGATAERKVLAPEDRRAVAEALIRGLQKIEQKMTAMKDDEWPEPRDLVAVFVDEISETQKNNCEYAQKKLGGSLKGLCKPAVETNEGTIAAPGRGPSSVDASPAISAASNQALQDKKQSSKRLRGIIFVASDSRFERNDKQEYEQKQMFSFGFGLRKGRWMGALEGGSFSESSSLGSLSLARKFEQYTGTFLLIPPAKQVSPFIGAGLGFYRETVDFVVDQAATSSKSAWETLNVFTAGIRFFANTSIWLSGEGRIFLGGRIDPDPMMGFLIRMGAEF